MSYVGNLSRINFATIPLKPRSFVTTLALIMLSLLMAFYGPMTSISHAQAANEYAQAQKMKQSVTDFLDSRISKYEKLFKRMQTNTTISISSGSDGVKTEIVTNPKYNEEDIQDTTRVSDFLAANPDINKGIDSIINFPIDVKYRVTDYINKIIEEFKNLKQTVKDMTSVESLKTLTKNIDAQQGVAQFAEVQAAVTQSVQSLTAVYNNIVATVKNAQARQDKIVECIANVVTGKSSATSTYNISGLDITQETKTSGPGCDDIEATDIEARDLSQAQLDNVKAVTSAIQSILSSSTTLLMTIVSQFEALVKNLGDYGMENLTKLGTAGTNVAKAMDINNLFKASGTIEGLKSSAAAIAPQLDTANQLSKNVSGSLKDIK